MGRELQKKKRRSGQQAVRRNPKSKKQILNNQLIADNWNSRETLSQNYRRLGLVSKLNKQTGSVEKHAVQQSPSDNIEPSAPATDPLAIHPRRKRLTEVRLMHDPKTGAAIVVNSQSEQDRAELRRIRRKERAARFGTRPLDDELDDVLDEHGSSSSGEDAEDPDRWMSSLGRMPHGGTSNHGITAELEKVASTGVRKTPRWQSEQEAEWIEKLVGKYGDDYEGMAKDMKLNPMQQTEGDLKRRVRRWKDG